LLIQMFMNSYAAAGERGAQLTAFELPHSIGEAHRVVARHDSFVLYREHQVEIFTPEWHERGSLFTGWQTEALIELRDIFFTQKAIGCFDRSEAAQSQLLRQTSLPG